MSPSSQSHDQSCDGESPSEDDPVRPSRESRDQLDCVRLALRININACEESFYQVSAYSSDWLSVMDQCVLYVQNREALSSILWLSQASRRNSDVAELAHLLLHKVQ